MSRAGDFPATLAMIALKTFRQESLVHLDDTAHGVPLYAIQRIEDFMPHIERGFQAHAHEFRTLFECPSLDHAFDVSLPRLGFQIGEFER